MPPSDAHRFSKDRPGNRRGRPPGALGLKGILERENKRLVTISLNDRPMRIPIREAIALKMAMLCARGDPRMIKLAVDTGIMEKLQPLIIQLLPSDIED